MKRISTYGILLLLISGSLSTTAQSTFRPKLFDAYLNIISCPTTELEKIFNTQEGSSLQLSFSNNTIFTGIISSAIQRFPNLKSVIVKLNNLQGTIFGISKRVNGDQSVSFIGRIINEQFADGFELKTDPSGNYVLNKINIEDVIQDHQ